MLISLLMPEDELLKALAEYLDKEYGIGMGSNSASLESNGNGYYRIQSCYISKKKSDNTEKQEE